MFIIKFLSQHVSGIIMPIIRRIRPCTTACGVLPACVGCGWLWLCGAACKQISISTCFGHHYAHHQGNKTVHYCMWCSAWVCRLWLAVVVWNCLQAAPHNHSQPQPTHPGRTPHAVVHGLILLMMGIMMPETCWNRNLIINIELDASCWFSLFTLPCYVSNLVNCRRHNAELWAG